VPYCVKKNSQPYSHRDINLDNSCFKKYCSFHYKWFIHAHHYYF